MSSLPRLERGIEVALRDVPEAAPMNPDETNGLADYCSVCGCPDTIELFLVDERGREQTIRVCSECGSDE